MQEVYGALNLGAWQAFAPGACVSDQVANGAVYYILLCLAMWIISPFKHHLALKAYA